MKNNTFHEKERSNRRKRKGGKIAHNNQYSQLKTEQAFFIFFFPCVALQLVYLGVYT